MMRIIAKAAAAALIATTAAQPALAAEDLREISSPQHRTAAFVGAAMRVPLGSGRSAARPAARLQAGFTHSYRDLRSAAPAETVRVASFELGASAGGKPAFYMAGREAGDLRDKLGASTGTVAVIGVGLLVGLLALAAAGSKGVNDDALCWDGEDCD
jgi:hypothetical protein